MTYCATDRDVEFKMDPVSRASSRSVTTNNVLSAKPKKSAGVGGAIS